MDGNLKVEYDENGDLLYEEERRGPAIAAPGSGPHFQNLVHQIEDSVLDGTATSLTEMVSHDESNRGPWEEMIAEAYELLGVGPESEPDDDDEDGAADRSDHPLLLTALTRFMSKALSSLLPSDEEAVNYKLNFDPNDIEDVEQRRQMVQDAHEAGRRVQNFYTHYLFHELDTYSEDTDQILMEMAMCGLGVRKVYTDLSRPSAPVQLGYVPTNDLFFSYDAKNFRTGRIAHRIEMPTPDLIRLLTAGHYSTREDVLTDGSIPDKDAIDVERDRIVGLSDAYMEGTESHTIYEIYCELFLDADPHPRGLARPYIVTIHAKSLEVLSIVRNWRPNDPDEKRIENFAGYLFSPGKDAIHGMGLGHILSNITRVLRTAQRRGMEAAYLQNHPSGFKLSSFKVRDDSTKVRSGEFIDVDSPTGDIRAALMMHPFEGPSPGLMSLAQQIESNGKQLGGLATQDLDNLMKAGMAAGPAMAAYEENTEFQTAVHRRLYLGQAKELDLLHERMREIVGNNPVPFGTNGMLRPGDLMMVNLKPRMKPGQASKQKIVLEAQAVLDISTQLPDIIDNREAAMDYLRALGKPNIDSLLKPDPNKNPPIPADPATEYGKILNGIPITAGLMQNHQAHIDAHSAQMRGIQTSQLPIEKGEAAMAVLAAHIAEHMAQDQVVQVAAKLGMNPQEFAEMPPELEAQIAPQIAAAINEIEAMRNPPEQQESKLAVEQVKGANAQALETMRAQQKKELQTMQLQHEKELQRMKDEAQMERALQDDDTAIEIASMKDANKASTKAGVVSG